MSSGSGEAKWEPVVRERPLPPSSRSRRQAQLAAFVGIALVLLVVVPWYFLKPGAETYRLRGYTYAVARVKDLRDLVPAGGTVLPGRKVDVLAVTGGTVEELLVAPGDDVAKGQALGRLSAPEAERKVREARRLLAEAEARQRQAALDGRLALQQAERDLEAARRALGKAEEKLVTTRRLVEAGVASRREAEDAEQALADARTDLEAREQGLMAARERARLGEAEAAKAVELAREGLEREEELLAATVLKAPMAGRVLAVEVVAGQTLQPGTKVLTMADVSRLSVQVLVDETAAARVSPGQPADILAGAERFTGRVERVAPQASAAQGQQGGTPMVEVDVSFDRQPLGVRPNSSVGVEIQVGERKGATVLPRGPYLTSGDQRLVYVIEGNRAVRREVTFGLPDGNDVEVTDVKPGEKVVTNSYEDFKDLAEVVLSPGGGRAQ